MNEDQGPSRRILILNYNGAYETVECVRSILSDEEISASELVIVDNGSTDDSVLRLRSEFPGITIVENGANLGYAEGFNVVLRSHSCDDVVDFLLLNNDTRIPKGVIRALQETLHSESMVGVIGPAVLEMDSDVVQSAGAMMDWPRASSVCRDAGVKYEAVPHSVKVVDYVSGCAMFIRAEVMRKVDFFDPALFMYSEEVDLCLRIANGGYKTVCDSRVAIEHRQHSTSGRYPKLKGFYIARNRVIMMKRHAPIRDGLTGLLWMILFETTVGSVRLIVRRGSVGYLVAGWRGLVKGMLMSIGEARIPQ